MSESTQILRSLAAAVRLRSGAELVSLFVPASDATPPLLIHDGTGDPIPEMADLGVASELPARRVDSATSDGANSSRLPAGRLLRLHSVDALLGPTLPTPQRSRRRRDRDPGLDPSAAWLGLRFASAERADDATSFLRTIDAPTEAETLFALGAALTWHARRVPKPASDPTTGLPSRVEFQANLTRAMERAAATGRPLTLLLVNPDDFARVNDRLGRDAGDAVAITIAERLRAALRSSDLVSRYGGAVFAAILTDTSRSEAMRVAEKLSTSLAEATYFDDSVRLGFSIGVAVFEPGEPSAGTTLDLVRQADQALHAAKRAGGGQAVEWQKGSEVEDLESLDRLSGIFTANTDKDYRNMVLLWDTVSVMARNDDVTGLARHAVARLFETLRPSRVGIFRWSNSGELHLLHGLARPLSGEDAARPVPTFALDAADRRLLELARQGEQSSPEAEAADADNAFAVPLLAGEECLGCLYLDDRQAATNLDDSDLVFLKALAGQLAVAFDRARLAEQDRLRLEAELKELRHAVHESRLLYCSPQMEAVISTIRRVAPTDANVLITGESGTGKELLARTLHELSPRRQQPLIVVDCGAIAETLIDSELFGHERGAYTGAGQRKLGRLAEADQGTVLLDEIGELPLEIQRKLLRFVQEKQFTPVGGTRPRRVDVRILAATNRDLESEVGAGRFREDLYHRLHVVHISVPPLRDRPDDIPYLATHWLEKYSVQYHKPLRRLSHEAEEALRHQTWSGNVRELQNRIMQAVILSETSELRLEDLRLGSGAAAAAPLPARGVAARRPTAGEAWHRLRRSLGEQIEAARTAHNGHGLPLGKWLDEDLVLEAYAAADELFKGGAVLLGVPEATFRRRTHRARDAQQAGTLSRSPGWPREVIADVVRTSEANGEDLLRRARQLLMEEIQLRLPEDRRLASRLMGVTQQTYGRWLQELESVTKAPSESI